MASFTCSASSRYLWEASRISFKFSWCAQSLAIATTCGLTLVVDVNYLDRSATTIVAGGSGE